MKYYLFFLLTGLFCSCSFSSEKDNWAKETPKLKYTETREKEVWEKALDIKDPALFYGTPLYDLATEMATLSMLRSDKKIHELINEIPKEIINYQEAKYGITIGHFALITKNIKAIQWLLDKGLNPDLISKDGSAIIIDINASFYTNSFPEATETLKYMITKGGNVNLYSKKNAFNTPLLLASSNNLKIVKTLVNAGANPHYTSILDWGEVGFSLESPLKKALDHGHIDIANYYIFEKKVDFKKLKNPEKSKFYPGDYEILHSLRKLSFDLNSKDYKEKMKLVNYLKTQGLDYWKTPIPNNTKNNPNFNNEYLSKY